jgi:small subunit ribosomal protein S21
MIIIEINHGSSLEKALKELKRKTSKTKLIEELRGRKTFVKKSVKRRTEVNKAVYKQSQNIQD